MKRVLYSLSLIFWMISCQKTDFTDTNAPEPQTLTTERSGATSIHQNAQITDKYDVMGRLWYHHHTKNVGGNPNVYLAPDYRTTLPASADAQFLADRNKPLSQLAQPLLIQQALTPAAVANIQQFRTLISGMPDNISPENAWIAIRQFEVTLIGNTSLDENDIVPALHISSILRNQLTYAYETGGLVDDRGDCFLGRKLSCWESVLTETMFASIKAALGIIAPTLLPGGGSFNFTAVKNAAYIAGGIATVLQIIKIYTNESCKCGETTPTPVDPCQRPTAIGLILGDCGPIQTARVMGFGSAGSGFTWSVQGGIAVDFPGTVTGILTAVPTLRIQQTNPNVPMVVTCLVTYASPCTGGPATGATIDIPKLVNDPGEVIVSGQSTISFGDPTIFQYILNGSWLASPNSVLSASGCSYHGTVMGSGINSAGSFFVNVKWNVKTNQYSPASVYGTSRNICSNNTKSGWLYPITIQ
jgi:hypothetical protein